jgi:hypothetical protein
VERRKSQLSLLGALLQVLLQQTARPRFSLFVSDSVLFIASKDYLVHEDAVAAVEGYYGRLQNLDLSGVVKILIMYFL